MKFSIKDISPEQAKAGCLVLGAFKEADKGADFPEATRRVDRASGGALRKLGGRGDFSARRGSSLLLHGLPGVQADRVLVVGLGARREFSENAYREAVRTAAGVLKDSGARDALLCLTELEVAGRPGEWSLRHAVLALSEALYRFDELKSKANGAAPRLSDVALYTGGKADAAARRALRAASETAEGVSLARTLGNLPSNVCTPAYLASRARKLARQFDLGIEVLERRDLQKLGLGAMLAVAKGALEPPKLIVLRYAGGHKGHKPIVLVGKGITFDTGGISLKPAAEMDEMKFDMSGAASVLGTLRALAAMEAPVNLVGVIPACENMPGGSATKPGDVVTTLSGQTVEILNTDAEGRLLLCDALTYAERFKPDVVVDIATLTGACVVALGHVASGLFANDQPLADQLKRAADEAWDRVWQLPLWEDYEEALRSNFADFANVGGRPGGSITAACFLSRFAKKVRWAHIDIAGTAWKSGREKGSTGRPVPLLVQFALRHAARR